MPSEAVGEALSALEAVARCPGLSEDLRELAGASGGLIAAVAKVEDPGAVSGSTPALSLVPKTKRKD
jgi:hypothetical protein